MRTGINIHILFLAIAFLSVSYCHAQSRNENAFIDFRPADDILYNTYKNNMGEMAKVYSLIRKHEDAILTGNGHIRLVAYVPFDKKDNFLALNMAARRAAVIRSNLRQQFRMLTKWGFTFYIDVDNKDSNSVKVEYIAGTIPINAPTDIYFSPDKDIATIKNAFLKYNGIPYMENAIVIEDKPMASGRQDSITASAIKMSTQVTKGGEENFLITIYYRWNQSNLDSLYLSNPRHLEKLDSILASPNASYIDSLTIVAFASPEGSSDYNKRLSQRRANTIRNYIISRYPSINAQRIVTIARGENWEGVIKFALSDPELPSRKEVLEIITSQRSNEQKQRDLLKLDGGKIYYRYILPNYYRYLRNGASLSITYTQGVLQKPEETKTPEPEIKEEPRERLKEEPQPVIPSEPAINYPIALRTNLLYDAVGAGNIGIEVPIREHWSIIADFAYAYWRSQKDRYALQTLEYGVEGRYWLGVNKAKATEKPEWGKPLRGWNVGVYGRYWQRYDVQWIDGYQGDGTWSAGITAGYSFPIVRNLTLEAGLGFGYLSTSQYRHYHQPEYDREGNRYLMWQQTGRWGGLSLTKLRLSLVWLIQTTKKGGK